MYTLHFIPRLVCLAIFSIYDTQCALYENASIFDCHQPSIVAQPKEWILCWLVLSILSTICFFLTVQRMCTKALQIRRTCKKVGFWSMIIIFLVTLPTYLLRVINTELKDMALFWALFLWWPSTVWQITYLDNFELHMYYDIKTRNRSGTDQLQWLNDVYELSLFTHFIECFAFAAAITLDAGLQLLPDAVIHGEIEDTLILKLCKIFFLLRTPFVYGICYLYLRKICHRDRTLFEKPGDPIEPATESITNV